MTASDLRGSEPTEEVELDRTKWRPSDEEFLRYLAREVEMAKANLARGAPSDSMLHSAGTIVRAKAGN